MDGLGMTLYGPRAYGVNLLPSGKRSTRVSSFFGISYLDTRKNVVSKIAILTFGVNQKTFEAWEYVSDEQGLCARTSITVSCCPRVGLA